MAKIEPEELSEKEKLCLQTKAVDKLIFVPKTVPKKVVTVVPREKTKMGPHLFHKHDDEDFIHHGIDGQATILGRITADKHGLWRLMFDKKLHDEHLSSLSTPFGQIRTSYRITSIEDMSSLTDIQHKFAAENCADTFNKLPTEVRERIYEYIIMRDFEVVDYKGAAEGSLRIKRISVGASILLNLQLSCRYLYEDIAIFNYQHHEFYFSDPRSIQSFLDCLEEGPISTVSSRHFGVVILDVRKNSYSHGSPLAWPAFGLEMDDWDEHLRILVHHFWYSKRAGKGHAADSIREWAAAVKRLLRSHTVGKLVIHGASSWPSALYSTTELVEALSDFKGQGRITRLCKAGTWPKKGWGKVVQMLKNTMELDASVQMKTKSEARGRKSLTGFEAPLETMAKNKAGGQKRQGELELPVRNKRVKGKPSE